MTEGVHTEITATTVSATATVDAPPDVVFDFLRRPANHPRISGDMSVKGTTTGPEVLSLNDRFGMNMKIGVPYRITNKVVEFESDRRIAWSHFFGHRWRWQVEPAGEGKSRVTETFDLSSARVPAALKVMGYPKGHEKNVAASVANLAAHFASRSSG